MLPQANVQHGKQQADILIETKPAIEARNVTKVFGTGAAGVTALDNVSVTIRQNEFFTLLGPSGCGKTTLLRMIAGFEYPTDGAILLEGSEIGGLPPFKRPVNTVFQSYALFPHMTVGENIGFGLEMLGRSRGEIDARVTQMLALVRMEALKDRRTDQISGGQAQRVALARALAPAPKVLLLDEPLSALDYKLRKEMQIELKRMQHETGITFVFVTHDQEEALSMSDRIAVMSAGRILQIGTPRDIYDHPAERFVADFIGEANFIEGDVVSVMQGMARVRLCCGPEIQARLAEGAPQAGRVTVVIRPEQLVFDASGMAGAFESRIEAVIYSGNDLQFHARLDDGTPLIARMPVRIRDATPEQGALARFALADGAAHVLKD
jgi:spermidine/putrescine transport system ATP-binding protein